ncbi:arylsulfatase-like [Amphiura filiformis]|uniref:arylsulfatase-like n=1 Tax=Amphiura filiformis TaxID=82378 RepID=UPI003B20C32E
MVCLSFLGGNGNFFEGGLRVPGIVRWPEHIPAGIVNTQVISQMDFFPTFVDIAKGSIPDDRIIDGQDIRHLLSLAGSSDEVNSNSSNHQPLFFYCNARLFAMRFGNYKLHYRTMPMRNKYYYAAKCGEAGFPYSYYFQGSSCISTRVRWHYPPLIYNLATDPAEAYPLNATLNQDLLQDVESAYAAHEMNLVKGPALFTSFSNSTIPCCDVSNYGCSCNYP